MTRARAGAWLAAALGITALCFGISRYAPFISDDALISLRYADRLIHGHGLTWNDGERVEGYSDLLWVLACAALGALGIDLVDAARILGVTGMATAIIAVAHAFGGSRRPSVLAAAYASLGLGLAAPMAVWAIGGLEQPLLAALLAIGVVQVWSILEDDEPRLRDVLAAGTVLGLVALVRPDGALFPVTIAATAVVLRAAERKRALVFLWVAGPAFSLASAQLLFRLVYYHDVVPNTAHAKLGGWSELHVRGLDYARRFVVSAVPLFVVASFALVASIRDRDLRRRVAVCVVPLVAWSLYVVRIGGDIFPAYRHEVASLVLLALIGAAFVERVDARVSRSNASRASVGRARIAASAGIVLALGWFELLQLDDPYHRDARAERWEWTCKRIAEAMGRAYAREAPLAAVDPAGCFPYWSKLPSLDMIGLNDRYIATHPPTGERWRYPLAHDLGDPAYVRRSKPDIVVLCSILGNATGCFPSGVGLTAEPSFHRDFRLVTFELPPAGGEPMVSWQYWLRFTSGPIGRRTTPTTISIPAHFFNASPARVTFDAQGRPSIVGEPATPFRIEALAIPSGRWRLLYESSKPMAFARLYRERAKTSADIVEVDGAFDVDANAAPLDLEIVPAATRTIFYALTLERTTRESDR